jgi:hypothetical protein
MDPIRDAQYDRSEAEKLRWEERHESNPAARNDLERAAQRFDEEANELESSVAETNEPESESEQ